MAVFPSRVLSLIGPPGSGKGSYGRHLADALNLSLLGMSDVLKEMRPDLDLSSGQLVDDRVVSDALVEFLLSRSKLDSSGVLLDGFPRTPRQIELMRNSWPVAYKVQAAVKLAVPDFVCETKLLGRRICLKCQGNFNIHSVFRDGWDLPPSLPSTMTANSVDCSQANCCQHWTTRPDDHTDVVQGRLKIYHEHMDPILDYFEGERRLMKVIPYHGYADVPQMIKQVQDWLATH